MGEKACLFSIINFYVVLELVARVIIPEEIGQKDDSGLQIEKSSEYKIYGLGYNRLQEKFEKKTELAKLDDFEIKRSIGFGSFGVVELVKHKKDSKLYAMKTIKLEENERPQFSNELSINQMMDSPFIVKLHYSFKDNNDGFLVFQFVRGGDFSKLYKNYTKMSEQQICFYMANMVMAIKHLHERNIIHQDLKPSNFLLDDNGYLLLTDFGLSHSVKKPCNSFSNCGTQDYMAPEIAKLIEDGISSGNYKEAVDWYALGAIMFELVNGKLLADSEQKQSSFTNMRPKQIELPEQLSKAAKDFLNQLLQNDPEKRLGTNGTESVIKHPFFKSIDWQKLIEREVTAPYLPKISESDSTQFEGYIINDSESTK